LSSYLSLLLLFSSLILFYFSFVFYSLSYVVFTEFNLIDLNGSSFIFLVLLDWISLIFIGLVFFISSMVLIYRRSYMKGDPSINKFIYIIFMFVLSMGLIILSPNIISILLGWDGLGLVSYCLVIYYQNVKSYNSGILTILSNRLGDISILLCISWIVNYGSFRFFYLQTMDYSLILVLTLVIIAAITKSAQIPFSAWLPAAIAAPTPVSSLVHSSTLVTAGVYLLIRFHSLFTYSYYLFFFSVLTLFISGLGANFETDLKKIIALSTLSQLGIMIISVSLGIYEIAFFHLVRHALFKSLLFLCAGFFIHSNGNWQDSRCLSGLNFNSPIISFYFYCASASLCGFPFLTGFYSKDLILEIYYMGEMNYFIFFL